MSKATKWVYYFGEGGKGDKARLGGKGANLSEMTNLGLPIPSGYIITAQACVAYTKDHKWPDGLQEQVEANLQRLEKQSGKKFGDPRNPLLVSVRSGAAVSMPGMMDTVLNLGLNEEIVEGLATLTKNPRFAYDAYRRFIQMFSDVVMGLKREQYEHVLEKMKHDKGVKEDTQLDASDLKRLVKEYFKLYESSLGQPFPKNPREQLHHAINAVFKSWENARARTYRNLHKISHNMGTAVSVQEMVYGNMGDDSATGVAFTRNPSTGENKRFGEYLTNAQGEDVVAGIRTPSTIESMQRDFPQPFKQLYDVFTLLEKHYRDMQDIEFTIERNKLFILQTRSGKRTAAASVKIAVDMVNEGLIPKSEAVLRVSPDQLETLMHKQLDPAAKKKAKVLAKGLPASPGAAVGQIVFDADTAIAAKADHKKTILVRLETSPEDIAGMVAAQGILTARGGMTSHAAVVARGMNIPCVAGCSDIRIDSKKKTLTVGDTVLKEWDWISLDGSDGEWYTGKMPVVDPDLKGEFGTLLKFADEFRKLDVYGNADTPKDAKVARDFGAVGIGLVRTEHMFFNPARILAVREMILADTKEAREKALAKLLPYQRDDFEGILEVMDGYPVVIRLIDPPLHEFLPRERKEMEELAHALGVDVAVVEKKTIAMHEANPMLGFRGCRLGVVYPEINAMQATAIFEAAVKLVKKGKKPRPHIEIPLVGKTEEFTMLKAMILDIAKTTGADEAKVHYAIGTMIEVPRAALVADELAKEAQFMSFGTNDLTQMTCGFSRDDAGVFLKSYVEKGIYASDPFQSIDQGGVGLLMKACVSLARSINPSIDFGICGEHAGNPESVEFCHRIRLNNVSPSPYRVPIARLAAAQAAIKYGNAPEPLPIFLKAKL